MKIEPEYENFKKEGEELGIIKKEEDVLTLAMLPPVAKQFLKGDLEEEPFPEVHIGGSGDDDLSAIPTEYSVEVDGDIFDVKIMPTGYMQIGQQGGSGNVGPIPGALTASMQGMVLKIKVNTGDKVQKGTVVAVLEAMKMENDIYAEEEGIVEQIFVEEGDTVNAGDNLMLIKPLDE